MWANFWGKLTSRTRVRVWYRKRDRTANSARALNRPNHQLYTVGTSRGRVAHPPQVAVAAGSALGHSPSGAKSTTDWRLTSGQGDSTLGPLHYGSPTDNNNNTITVYTYPPRASASLPVLTVARSRAMAIIHASESRNRASSSLLYANRSYQITVHIKTSITIVLSSSKPTTVAELQCD